MHKTIKYNNANLCVWYQYIPPTRGAWEHGVQIEPDYPEDAEIDSIYFEGVDVMPIFDYDTINDIVNLVLTTGENDE